MENYNIQNMMHYKKELASKSNLAFMGCVETSSPEKPIIGTQALVTCHGILFYDRARKFGVVGHGVTNSDKNYQQVLLEMIEKFNDGEKHEVEYTIVPGYMNAKMEELKKTTTELIKYIEEFNSSKISFVPAVLSAQVKLNLQMPIPGYEFAFDTETGKYVTDYLFFDENDNNLELGGKVR